MEGERQEQYLAEAASIETLNYDGETEKELGDYRIIPSAFFR